jgi:putative SOS response-associated peptidase YedK
LDLTERRAIGENRFMCNLYATTTMRSEIARIAKAMTDHNDNQPPIPGVFPDYAAPVVLHGPTGEREMRDLRWGLPSPRKVLLDAATKRADKLRIKGAAVAFPALLRAEPDKGVTNIRNTASSHWRPWLGQANRCLVPFTSFCEPDQVDGSLKPVWFALDESRPLAFFAGVWAANWTCVRKIKEGEVCVDLFGFLTTEANAEVRAHHDKAMPVILTTEADRDLWMSAAPWSEVAHLQRPLRDGALRVVARDVRQDTASPA